MLDKNQTAIHDKKTQKIKNRGDLQHDKGYLQRIGLQRPMTNVIFNGEKLKAFLLRSQRYRDQEVTSQHN